jgi:hypothetical protein
VPGPARTRPWLLSWHAPPGGDDEPRIDVCPQTSPQAAAAVRGAVWDNAELTHYDCLVRFDVLLLPIAMDGLYTLLGLDR